MGSSMAREEVLQSEQDVLNSMNPPVKFDSYDVMCNSPIGLQGEATEADPFPIRTLRIRARDNCAPETAEDELGDPIVLLHGYACGLAVFYKLLPILVDRFQINARPGTKRDIYAFDFLGQGASGRPPFDLDKEDVDGTERYLAACIDGWVCAQFPNPSQRIHLCGHSFGGCCSALYSLYYPHRIASLGLISPLLGFQPREEHERTGSESLLSWIVRLGWERQITPHSVVYSLGSIGSWLANRGSQRRFQAMATGVSEQEGEYLSKYIAGMLRLEPSNARSLLTLFRPGLLAKRPLLERLLNKECRPHMHVCYGEMDWMRRDKVVEKLPKDIPYAVLDNSHHHVYLDNPIGLADHLAKNVLDAI